MIKSVRIKNFKGLKSFALEDIGKINLLGGKNNAGKTTFLEALFMFYDRLDPNMLLRQYNWRGVNEVAVTEDSLFSPIFHNFDLKNDIEIEVVNHNCFKENMVIKYKNSTNKIITMKSNEGQIRTDENVPFYHSLGIQIKSSQFKEQNINLIITNTGIQLEAKEVKPPSTASFLAAKSFSNPSENAIRFGNLDIHGQSDIIISFLQIIEPRLISLSTITQPNNTSMIYGDIGIGKKLPISYMGDGISRLLTILLSIVSNKNGILFIDEIENGIHYSVLNKVWEVISKAANDYDCQIFATTHSYECLNASLQGIREEVRDDFRYFRVERSKKEDRIVGKAFNYEMLKSAIDRGWEVR